MLLYYFLSSQEMTLTVAYTGAKTAIISARKPSSLHFLVRLISCAKKLRQRLTAVTQSHFPSKIL